VKEKVLLSGRYGAVEIDKSGIITGFNDHALKLLSGPGAAKVSGTLENVNIAVFASGENAAAYDFWYEIHKGVHESLREFPV